MKIAVGSTNPVKIKAAENVMKRIYGKVEAVEAVKAVEVVGMAVESGVSDNPWTAEEAMEGAKNRALHALERSDADFGVGFEGGTIQISDRCFTQAWCAVVDRKKEFGLGGSVHLELPDAVVKLVKDGKELGTAIDQLIGENDTKRKMGAVGALTKNLMSRQAAYESILTYAMAKFVSPERYTNL